MGNHNSLGEDFYLHLFIASYNDVASASAYSNVEIDRDIVEIRHRYRHEGLSFLTKTIPSLGKAVDKALSTATPLRCSGFELKRNTQIPRFFGCLLTRVFDDLGYERSDACIDSLKWLRQACALLYKLEVPTTEKQNNEIIDSFKKTDYNLPEPYPREQKLKGYGITEMARFPIQWETDSIAGGLAHVDSGSFRSYPGGTQRVDNGVPNTVYDREGPADPNQREMRAMGNAGKHDPPKWGLCNLHTSVAVLLHAKRLVQRVVGVTDPRGPLFAPRHGPGAVAGGEKPHEKSSFRRYYRELCKEFPFERDLLYNTQHLADTLPEFLSLEEVETGTAKVVLVPKDSRGPRLISCEPVEYQWVQQGLKRTLEGAIASSPLTSGRVNFLTQEVNRRLALESSNGAPWVTLDMKDASDRVSVALVQQLFPEPWLSCLLAARSSATRLPSGEVVHLKKYAPMGSALCFPVESLIFWALAVGAIQQAQPELTASQAAERVYVFGDDLIVRLEDHQHVLQQLPRFGLMFNPAKCCVAGSFRESCGCDAYKGVDITPLKIKSTWSHRSGSSFVSYVALHNAATRRGMFNLADLVASVLLKQRYIPYSENEDVGYVCLVDHRKTMDEVKLHNRRIKRRYNPDLQRWEWFTWSVRARSYRAGTSGWSEMLRLASYKSFDSDSRPAPVGLDLVRDLPWKGNFSRFLPNTPSVRAYQYALPRQATLRRGWLPIY